MTQPLPDIVRHMSLQPAIPSMHFMQMDRPPWMTLSCWPCDCESGTVWICCNYAGQRFLAHQCEEVRQSNVAGMVGVGFICEEGSCEGVAFDVCEYKDLGSGIGIDEHTVLVVVKRFGLILILILGTKTSIAGFLAILFIGIVLPPSFRTLKAWGHLAGLSQDVVDAVKLSSCSHNVKYLALRALDFSLEGPTHTCYCIDFQAYLEMRRRV